MSTTTICAGCGRPIVLEYWSPSDGPFWHLECKPRSTYRRKSFRREETNPAVAEIRIDRAVANCEQAKARAELAAKKVVEGL